MQPDEDERLRVRRGAEHVRVGGTTEELGEIVAPPVITDAAEGEVKVEDDVVDEWESPR